MESKELKGKFGIISKTHVGMVRTNNQSENII